MTPAPESGSADKTGSQTFKAQAGLRALIVSGALPPGMRVAELPLVERLGVSRTPVRHALARLEEEGLLTGLPSGGYAVKLFSEQEALDSIELRGTLEGLAARLAAERGAAPAVLRQAALCVARLDELFAVGGPLDMAGYVALNAAFHDLVVELAASQVLARQLERVCALPFASPSAFALLSPEAPEKHLRMAVAQDQHRSVLQAIERREGARAEALMREHARLAHRDVERAFAGKQRRAAIPGITLIAPATRRAKPIGG